MKRLLFALAAGVAMVGAAATLPAAPPRKPAAAARDWSGTVAATPEGGFRMGNPAARARLIEYGSFTCGHCARFSQVGMPGLLPRVKSGRLSFEYRPFVRDPADIAAALLARCAAPARFFALSHRYFASQDQWLGRLQALPSTQTDAIAALPEGQRFGRLAAAAGLDTIAAQAGIAPARARQCLADPAGLNKLIGMTEIALKTHKLNGTPTFILNGVNLNVTDWASLEPLLARPGG